MTDAKRDRLAQLLDDLAAESELLDSMVAPLDDSRWRAATPAQGWDIAHQIAHLAWTDEVAVTAATDKPAWDEMLLVALDDPTGFVDRAADQGATAGSPELLERWRCSRKALAETLAGFPDGGRIAWFGPPMSPASMATARLMETWAHAMDVADALGQTMPASNRLRHVVYLGVRTRDFAFTGRGLPAPPKEFRVELIAPDGREQWAYGPDDADQRVRGSAYDFSLLVTRRRHRADLDLVAEGADAEQWLEIAQAFAGPAGGGRPPTRDRLEPGEAGVER